MPWVVEITGYDTVAAVDRTFRFAMQKGVAFTDTTYAPGGLMRWSNPSQKIDIARTGKLQVSPDDGEIVIANLPDELTGAGPNDALADYSWNGRKAFLYWVPGAVWADKVLVAMGITEQPIVNLNISGRFESALRFPLRDPRKVLETPVQGVKFAGTNVGPAGVEGGPELKGQPKPILYGAVSNISPPRVNESLLIYQVADKAVSIGCVRDGGVPLGVGVARANLASLQANDPTPGTYDYLSDATGTYFRLGSTPIFGIACDAHEGANNAARTHGQLWKRFRLERCGNVAGDIDDATVVAVDALDAAEAGFWLDGEATQKEALDFLLSGFGAFEVFGLDQKWRITRLVAPVNPPSIELVLLTPSTQLKVTQRPLSGIQRLRPSYMPDGLPPFRVKLNWGQNYTVMADTQFAGAAIDRLRVKFAERWRGAVAEDLATWNPTTKTGKWPNAPELEIDSAYGVGADGLTCPAADTEVTRLLALYGTPRAGYQVSYIPDVTDQVLLPGSVVKLTYPMMGLSAGKLFRVMQSGWFVENGKTSVSLVLGLQT